MYSVGVDIGGSYVKIGVFNKFKLVLKDQIETANRFDPKEIIREIFLFLFEILKKYGIEKTQINSIGFGSPGIVDYNKKCILYSCNIKYNNFNIETEAKKYIDTKIFVENDANCAALGEHIMSVSHSSLTVTLGTGVGGGFIINNKIFRGFNGSALEIGHMIIGKDNVCPCGQNGCFESYCSAIAFDKLIKNNIKSDTEKYLESEVKNVYNKEKIFEISPKELTSLIFKGFKLNNSFCLHIVKTYVNYLSRALANLINILAPEKIIISGGFSYNVKHFHNLLVKETKNKIYIKNLLIPHTEIIIANLGNYAGVYGAAFLDGS